jgi:uncharacterized protein
MQDPGTSNRTLLVAGRQRHPTSAPRFRAPAHVYDLRSTGNSDTYFSGIAQFSAEWVARIESRAGVLLDGYTRHTREVLSEAPHSRAEYALEFLTLGMALHNYEAAAELTPHCAVRLGAILVSLRKRVPTAKPLIDKARALLSALWIDRSLAEAEPGQPPAPLPACPPMERLTRLIAWLHATGEFEQEALRLANWRSYFAQLRPVKFTHWMSVSVELFNQFAAEAAPRLGLYTRGVAPFLASDYTHRGLREDRLFCGRPPSEYHLNMVAAEVMNQGLRPAFERTAQKIVLVPACMRGAKASQCLARVDGVDIACAACDPECAINHITRRMKAFGVKVYIVPHATGFSRWLTRWQREPNVGVAAVACMLNILPGGYEMRARGIASQCVPLDFPGCRKHWDRHGLSTAVNEDRLVQIVTGLSPAPGAPSWPHRNPPAHG